MNPQQPSVVVMGGWSQPQSQPAPQTVVHTVSQAPPTVRIQESNGLRHKDAHKILGIIQMVAGSLCMALSIIGLLVGSPQLLFGNGIYTGILFILAGLFGFLASKHEKNRSRSRRFLVACMIMNIIGTCVAVIGISLVSLELIFQSVSSSKEAAFQRAKAGIVLFIIFFEFITTIVHASITCSSRCQCCMQTQVVPQPAPPTGSVVVQQVGTTMAPAGQGPMPQQQYTAQQPIHVQHYPQQEYTTQQPMHVQSDPQQQYIALQPMQAQHYPQQQYTTQQPMQVQNYPQQHNAAFSPDDSMGALAALPPPDWKSDLKKK